MFIGHFAVGFASKRFAPQVSLALLIAAPLFLDILFPVFVAVGIEHARISPGITAANPLDLYDYPYSHSLLAAVVWSILGAAAYFLARRDRTVALVIGIGVFSHWILDWISHRPDMPLYPGGSTLVGLGLWNSVLGTILVEGGMFAVAIAIYVRTTRPQNRRGSVGFWTFVVVLLLLYAGNFLAPPPPSIAPVVAAGIGSWIFFVWIWWFDRWRTTVPEAPRGNIT